MPVVGALEIIVILVAVILFGPRKVPEIARQLGTAVARFRNAGNELMNELTAQEREDKRPDQDQEREALEHRKLPLDSLQEAAHRLGIETEGKDRERLRSDIMEVIYSDQPPATEDQSEE